MHIIKFVKDWQIVKKVALAIILGLAALAVDQPICADLKIPLLYMMYIISVVIIFFPVDSGASILQIIDLLETFVRAGGDSMVDAVEMSTSVGDVFLVSVFALLSIAVLLIYIPASMIVLGVRSARKS